MALYKLERASSSGVVDAVEVRVFFEGDHLGQQMAVQVVGRSYAARPLYDGLSRGFPGAIWRDVQAYIARLRGAGYQIVTENQDWWPEADAGGEWHHPDLVSPHEGEVVLVMMEAPNILDLARFSDGRYICMQAEDGGEVVRWYRVDPATTVYS